MFPPDGPAAVFGLPDLRAAGLTRSALRHRVARGDVLRVGPGLYAVTPTWRHWSPRERLAAAGLACHLAYHPDKVLSHLSAAAIHGLALPLDPGRATWLTLQGTGRARRAESLIVQEATLHPDDVDLFGTAAVTTVARTVADCARHLALPDAVALADSAARLDPAFPNRLGLVLQSQRGWPGARGAAVAYELVDGRRESWLESYSFTALHGAGLPMPEPQIRLYDERGRFVARVDGLWWEWGVVGEADGLGKYAVGVSADPVAAVLAEKAREDRIRDLGLEVVRWTTGDIVHRLDMVLERLAAARERGDPGRLRGAQRATPVPRLKRYSSLPAFPSIGLSRAAC